MVHGTTTVLASSYKQGCVNVFVRNANGSLTAIPGLPLAIPAGVSRVGYIPSN